ncbi:hypothetical protein [uncultured Gammaproteobacteria bacterium]|nr:hypothetical protein [uncultured Gammaproteobacteria bacterium]CAC9564005.1 hypothetical protein [uncultured Gammaproteobacteria bacterium]CAC9577438.1 hypothetical protein [uncultured Gammaproteobacteria bacterium]CAC9580172.1 hypothetical protein [uncultured Gammaproteobacteria bacterium]CAC9971561.1 hypothetical protein [uncultured Gammaproteobacteria bacterium]
MEESPLDVNKAYAFVLCEGVEVVCTSTEIIYDKGVPSNRIPIVLFLKRMSKSLPLSIQSPSSQIK